MRKTWLRIRSSKIEVCLSQMSQSPGENTYIKEKLSDLAAWNGDNDFVLLVTNTSYTYKLSSLDFTD